MSIQVTACLNPFSGERKEFSFEQGITINEIIRNLDALNAVNTGWRVMIDDEIVTDFERVPEEGQRVYIKLVPEGDNNKDSGAGMKIAGGLLTVVGVILAFTPASALGFCLIGCGVGMFAGGVVLYNTDIPSLSDREKPEQDPSIRGSRNQMRPYGKVPVLLGKRRIYADACANPYTWVDSEGAIWLHQLFCVAQKDIQIDTSTLKIDETLLKDYSATGDISRVLDQSNPDPLIQMKISYGDSTPPLYDKCVHEIQLNTVLKHQTEDEQDGSVIRTTPAKTTKINVDVFFYNGLGEYNGEGRVVSTSVELKAEYKKSTDPDSAYQLLGYFSEGSNTISGNELKTKRYAITKDNLTADSYTVKISRVTADSTDTKIIDTVYVGSIRAANNDTPVRSARCQQVTLIGLKIKASEKLNNIVEQLNFVAQSKMPVYNSQSHQWTNALTSNPASAAMYAMQGEVAQQRLSNSDIDLDSFAALYSWCANHDYECNAYITDDMTINDLLSSIASTCRAEILRMNGKITVIQDIAKDSFVQLFTPRNSHDYKETMVLADIPDVLKMGIVDKTNGYAENEVPVYNTPSGNPVSGVEPQTSQSVPLWGITDSVQARKLGMYNYAVSKHRFTVVKFSCDFEYLMCRKGDWIKYSGDIALAGLKQGRIEAVDGQTLILDEQVTMESGSSYAVRIRKSDGTAALCNVQTVVGTSNEITISGQIPSGVEGCLFAFGITGNETIDLIVTDIQCGEDLSADLTCVEYAPEIFGVDNPDFVLPDFVNKLSDVDSVVDPGDVDGWRTFATYNDSDSQPTTPTGGGTSGSWHLQQTENSKWISTKTAASIYEGEWSAPMPTGKKVMDVLVPEGEIDNPDNVTGVTAIARQNEIVIQWNLNADDGLHNSIANYIVQVSKDSGNTWNTGNQVTGNLTSYIFNRDTNADGFPERETFATWRVRVTAVNIYGKNSTPTVQTVDASSYGTWIPVVPSITECHAERDGISIRWTVDLSNQYGTSSFIVQLTKNGSTVNVPVINNDYAYYYFDRANGEYPETSDFANYSVIVKHCNESNTSGVPSQSASVTASGYKTWIPVNITNAKAVAEKDTITFSWTCDNSDVYGTNVFTVKRNGTALVTIQDNSFTYYFNRNIGEYPEISDFSTAAWGFSIEVTNESTASHQNNKKTASATYDTSSYLSWLPAIPVVSFTSSSRTVSLQIKEDNSYWGWARFELQISMDKSTWYSVYSGNDDVKTSEEYWKDTENAVTQLFGRLFNQELPLKDQGTATGAKDTNYYYQVRAVTLTKNADGTDKINNSRYCTAITAIARATSAFDVVNNAITTAKLNDSAVTTAKINNNAITAAKIAANTITAEKLNAVAVNKINSFTGSDTVVGSLKEKTVQGWTIPNTDDTRQIATDSVTGVKCLKITAGNQDSIYSDYFEVKPDEILKLSATLDNTANSSWKLYIGLKPVDYTAVSGASHSTYMRSTYDATTGKWGNWTRFNNPYFIGAVGKKRVSFSTYICGSDIKTEDLPSPSISDSSFTVYAFRCFTVSEATGSANTNYNKASLRFGFASGSGTYSAGYLIAPLVTSVTHRGTIVAEDIKTEFLSAISANLGDVAAGSLASAVNDGEPDPDNSLVYIDGKAEEEEFYVGNIAKSAADIDVDSHEFIWLHKVNNVFDFVIKITNFIVTSAQSIIKGIFRVKNALSDTEANAFMTVNPTSSADNSTPAKTMRLLGMMDAKYYKHTKVAILTGSSQAKITLDTLMTWLITTKAYIPSNNVCHVIIQTTWSYTGNDILQLSIDGLNYELQLAGVVIEFMGNATNYNTGEFRLRIHSSPTLSFTATSGYYKFPVNHIAEYTCNGSSFSPKWKMLLEDGDSARAISGALTCSTAAETTAKTVDLPGFKLEKGARIIVNVQNSHSSSVAGPLTLNVNSTGAKTIRSNGTVTSSSSYTLNAGTYNCYYDGIYWCMDSSFDAWGSRVTNGPNGIAAAANFGGVASCATAAATAAKTASCYGYKLIIGQSVKLYISNTNTNESSVPTLNIASTGAKNIFVNGVAATKKVGDTASNLVAGWYICFYDGIYYQLFTANTLPAVGCAVCLTAAGTAAKVATMPSFSLVTGTTFLLYLKTTNTVASPTLKINDQTAKPIFVNGAAATASNLTAGIYLVRYDGTNFCIDKEYMAVNARTANSASKLTTARKVYVKLGTASTTETKDFSGDTAIPVNGTLPVANGGTGQSSLENVRVGNSRSANNIVAFGQYASLSSPNAITASLPKFALESGQAILLYMKNDTPSPNTVNVTLNVNATGAKTVVINGSNATKHVPAGLFIAQYDGTYWSLFPILNNSTANYWNDWDSSIGPDTDSFYGALNVKAWYFSLSQGYIVFSNGLCIQWERNKTITSNNTLYNFPLSAQFTQTPLFIPSWHANANSYLQLDTNGYYIDKTGFKIDYYSDAKLDYIAIGY